MVKIDIVTKVNVDDKEMITLTCSDEAEVQYTFNKALPKNKSCEIWVRAGTEEKLKLLTIKAASKAEPIGEEPAESKKHYPKNNGCPGLSFKTLHKLPNGECLHSDPIFLKDDRYFDKYTRGQLFDNEKCDDPTEFEAIVLTNNSNEDIDNVEVFVARDG